MSMSTGQEGYASQAYRPPGGAPEPSTKRRGAPRAETRAVASLGRRTLVCLVDMAIIGAVGGALGGLAGAMIGLDALLTGGIALGWLAAIPAIGIVLVLAYVVMQAMGGSLAQRWFDVRVVRAETGDRVGFARALGRHLLWALAGVIVVGYFSPLFDGSARRQGWHDKATGTLVVDVSEARAAVSEVAFAPLAPQHEASATTVTPEPAVPAAAWAPEAPAHPAAPTVAATAAPQVPTAAPALQAPAGAPAAPAPPRAAQSPAPSAAPTIPPASPAPPVPDPVARPAQPIPVDTPAPPAPPAPAAPAAESTPSGHDSFAPPAPDHSTVSDDTIALPPRGRPTPRGSVPALNAEPRDPFAPPEVPASVAESAPGHPPVAPAASESVAAPPAPLREDPVPPVDPMTVPVPPDEDPVDDTIVLNRRPAAPAEQAAALLSGDGFALMTDVGGLSIVRRAEGSDIAVTRGGGAVALPVGAPVRLAAGDVLRIGDRSITVGDA